MVERRKPLAIANWKMAMTIEESLSFLEQIEEHVAGLLGMVDVVVCPPATALWAMAQKLPDSRLQLGAQDFSTAVDPAHTGELSASLLSDAGAQWALIGHWEARRRGDDDETANAKVHLALAACLMPIVLLGEARGAPPASAEEVAGRLATILRGCTPAQVEKVAFVYEPEEAIGEEQPAPAEQVEAGCAAIRRAVEQLYGPAVGRFVRVAYGGSVTPEYAAELLSYPDVDGLGAGRQGRDPKAFAHIIRRVAEGRQGLILVEGAGQGREAGAGPRF